MQRKWQNGQPRKEENKKLMNKIIVFNGIIPVSIQSIFNSELIVICLDDNLFFVNTALKRVWLSDKNMSNVDQAQRNIINSIINKSESDEYN